MISVQKSGIINGVVYLGTILQLCRRSASSEESTFEAINQGLHQVPENIPNNTKTLILKRNRISCLGDNELSHLTDLLKADLSNNEIVQINNTAFNGTKLEFLNIAFNRLTKIPPMVGISDTLTTIIIKYNQISDIRGDSFDLYLNLDNITLNENEISNISVDAFQNLVNLKNLGLIGNPIRYESHEWFRNLTAPLHSLVMIHIGWVPTFYEIPDFSNIGDSLEVLFLDGLPANLSDKYDWNWETLSKLTVLKKLSLGSNSLTQIPEYIKLFNQTLTVFEINDNKISSLDHTLFQEFLSNMAKLETLNLGNNYLQRIPTIGSSLNLIELKLWGNNISIANQDILLDTPGSFEYLDLHDNPLECDERNLWLKEVQIGLLYTDFIVCVLDVNCAEMIGSFHDLGINDLKPRKTIGTTYFRFEKKGRITKDPIKTLFKADKNTCAMWCTTDESCSSFSLSTFDGKCHLYDRYPRDWEIKFATDTNWDHFIKYSFY